MEITNKKVVSLIYELRTEGFDSEVIETATTEDPLRFIYGIGEMLPSFEEQIAGLKPGDKFQFKLTSDQAYGPYDERNITDIPIQAFMVDGELMEDLLQIGNIIPLRDAEGNEFIGEIKEIKKDTVVMDFNHPMAGKDLYFTGEILEVRDATPEELAHRHVH